MQTITINGKTLSMKYTMLTGIVYQRMTGRNPLDLKQFDSNEIEPIIQMGYSLLLSSNEVKDVPDYVEVLKSISDADTMMQFVQATSAELKLYFQPANGDIPGAQPNSPASPEGRGGGQGAGRCQDEPAEKEDSDTDPKN